MTSIFRGLISNPTTRAYVLAAVRHLLTLGGGALVALLNAHGLNIGTGDAATMTGDLVGIGMILAGQMLAAYDVSGVKAKMVAAIAAPPDTPVAAIDSLKSAP